MMALVTGSIPKLLLLASNAHLSKKVSLEDYFSQNEGRGSEEDTNVDCNG